MTAEDGAKVPPRLGRDPGRLALVVELSTKLSRRLLGEYFLKELCEGTAAAHSEVLLRPTVSTGAGMKSGMVAAALLYHHKDTQLWFL